MNSSPESRLKALTERVEGIEAAIPRHPKPMLICDEPKLRGELFNLFRRLGKATGVEFHTNGLHEYSVVQVSSLVDVLERNVAGLELQISQAKQSTLPLEEEKNDE